MTRHSAAEDALAMVTGTVLVGTGVYTLAQAGLVTGGTAGLSLLLSYAGPVPFGVLFALVNLPFFAIAARQRGRLFTVLSAIGIGAVSLLSANGPALLGPITPNPVFAVLAGNLLCGTGVLVLFRHGSSLGGFNVIALLAQDRFGWRAGWVLLVFDSLVIAGSALVTPLPLVLASALGAVVLNAVIALNHRPDRYVVPARAA
ncbi:membrane protein [Actinoplanes sp. OR16]|uniref:YitT family protein n=1 Tax=Actinoplanes sp. OR16 TaxID=946334 RepID=UPI000F6CFBDC|nr:YitT family protein [Actinoplanes sp. OR16]BBH69998.1 membrane protein [Actinoplanes sp. OR16]